MTKFKKLVSLFLAIAVLMSIVTISVDAVEKNKFEYTLKTDEDSGITVAEITGYKGLSAVKIPAKIGKYKVKSIGPRAFRNKKNIKSVVLGPNVKEINESAFSDCINLKKINLRNVEFIGQNAFRNCSSLETVKIPSSLIGVTGDAFSGCKKLIKFKVGQGNYYYESIGGVLIRKGAPHIVAFPQAKGTSYVVPDGIKGIGAGAFKDNKTIRKIVIKKDVQTIEENAFDGCSNLVNVKMGNNVTQIQAQAFRECRKLYSVKFSKLLTSIDEEAFLGCKKLKTIRLFRKLESIGDRAFGYMRKDGKYQKIKGVKIIAPSNSKAEKYAKTNGISFKSK